MGIYIDMPLMRKKMILYMLIGLIILGRKVQKLSKQETNESFVNRDFLTFSFHFNDSIVIQINNNSKFATTFKNYNETDSPKRLSNILRT